MVTLLIIFGIMACFPLAMRYISSNKLLRLKELQKEFNNYHDYNDQAVTSKKNEITDLLLGARVSDFDFLHIEQINMMQGFQTTAKGFTNMFMHRIDVKANMEKAFDTAIGTYAKRKRDAFSLAFWIETIVFLPTKLGSYLGASREGTFMKIAQLIYWLISAGLPFYKFVLHGI